MKYVELPDVEPDQVSLKLFPCKGNPEALVVWLHGGGWVTGDRRNVRGMPGFFEEHGLLFISANYPLSPSAEVNLIDLQIQALHGLDQWLTNNSLKGTYPAAFQNINLLAHSAGSHLVALADKRFGWSSSIRSLILMDSGAYDLKARFNRMRPFQKKKFAQLIGLDRYPMVQHADILRDFSPALLQPKARDVNPLDVVIVSSNRAGARYSAERLKSSYSGQNYSCRIYLKDWDHEYFPHAVGVDSDLNNLILDVVSPAIL
ncbi:MAG: alpha/beta hydrolase fold domain-containing protein [Planctomycetota bacterium]|nr:alpha/beta hydrolase fold domain-containing protein [Planctomycetota bacterium]